MTSFRFHRSVQAAAAFAVLLAVASPAQALSTWNFNNGGCVDANAAAAFGNTYTCNSAIPTVKATAWSTTTLPSGVASGTAAGAQFASAYLSPNSGVANNSGFGVKNQTEGLLVGANDHALDNNGQTDAMLLSFAANSPVALTSITLGFKANDADISLLRYTGSSAPVIAGKTIAGLLTSGWELVGNYANLATGANAVNSVGRSSSWWLVSAYNAFYGSSGSANGTGSAAVNFDSSADYIKVLAVAGTPSTTTNAGAPEPGSLALVGAALAGLLVVRRRASAAA